MTGHRQQPGIFLAIAVLSALALSGCGTSVNPAASSPPGSGGIQAASQPAAGAMLGYVWDSSNQGFRPVKGVAGASVLGAAVISTTKPASGFAATASSTRSGMALFLDAAGSIFQSQLSGGKLTQVASLPGASNLMLSNAGTTALVTGKDASGASVGLVISGLPNSPSPRTLDLSATGSVVGGAASDSGAVALAASSGSGVSFLAFPGAGTGIQVAAAGGFGGMQFVPDSDELIVGDSSTGAFTAILHVGGSSTAAALSSGGIISPVGLEVTSDRRWVVAANRSGDVLRIDLSGATAAATSHCSCSPSQVLAMSGTTVRLVTAAGGPLWIVDAGRAAPKVLFIPPAGRATVPTITTKSSL